MNCRFACDQRGVAAIEFALLAPAFLMLLVGTMSMSIVFFTISSLNFAVDAAARCASVGSTVCRDAATTTAFAAANYFSSTNTAVFVCTGRVCGTNSSCGNRVSGTVNMSINVGIASYSAPLSAVACYP